MESNAPNDFSEPTIDEYYEFYGKEVLGFECRPVEVHNAIGQYLDKHIKIGALAQYSEVDGKERIAMISCFDSSIKAEEEDPLSMVATVKFLDDIVKLKDDGTLTVARSEATMIQNKAIDEDEQVVLLLDLYPLKLSPEILDAKTRRAAVAIEAVRIFYQFLWSNEDGNDIRDYSWVERNLRRNLERWYTAATAASEDMNGGSQTMKQMYQKTSAARRKPNLRLDSWRSFIIMIFCLGLSKWLIPSVPSVLQYVLSILAGLAFHVLWYERK